ncbi:nucleoside hydrolase [Escherichia coli]|uniref:nucleoside hydrolase n=1 Tax=Escherichia coli TaxID=562 RepID=UPI00265D17DD|nr:nucleoside hydrolase [Escherichia coli]MDO0557837.1 nucleoside hydrolase [Escherichia coli]
MALPILLDCDPGHDDAIAIVLALASPELDVKAITSSAGNQTPEKTLRNVLRMLTLLNRTDIPVAGGAVKPLMRELIIADNVHGESGLDVTHKAQIHVEDTERFRAIGNPVSTIVAELLDFFLEYHKDEKWGFVGAPLHDPCTIAWLLKPELFTTVERWVGVETQGKYSQGMTVVDYYYLTGNKPNATVMVDVDRQGFVDLLADRLKFYA